MARRNPFRLTVGEWGWLGLVTFIVAVDTHAWRCKDETMSVAFGRWIQTPRGRAVCVGTWGLMTAHLFWSVPLPYQTKMKALVVQSKYERK